MHLTRATIIARSTADGLVEMDDRIPIGTRYVIDLDTLQEDALLYNIDRQVNHRKTIVDAQQRDGSWVWIPMELLKVDADG